MSAAYLRAPDLPASALGIVTFDPGCTGKLKQGRREAGAAAARRRQGAAYECGTCGAFHTSRLDGPPVPAWRRRCS